jgi:uncharacterized membrane protein YhhN
MLLRVLIVIVFIIAFLKPIMYFKVVPSWFFLFLIPYVSYGCVILKLLSPNLKKLVAPVAIYMCAILMMSFTSACGVWAGFNLKFILPFIGSLFFITSDSVLSYNSFNKPSKNYEVLIMGTYILAQVMIVAGFLY